MINIQELARVEASKFSFPYLAGLVDGEGCIQLILEGKKEDKKYWAPRVVIAQKNKAYLESIRSFLGYGNIQAEQYLVFSSRQAQRFLACIGPYLVLKRKEASDLLEAIFIIRHRYQKVPDPKVDARLLEIRRNIMKNHSRKNSGRKV